MTESLKGRPIADRIREDVAKRVASLKERDIEPMLAILRVGEAPDDLAYEASILRAANALGINVNVFAEDESTSQERMLALVDDINQDDSIHGCLIFRPLPQGLDEVEICNRLSASKDIDGCGAPSLAGVFMDLVEGYAPATAQACIELLDFYDVPLAGKKLCVVGRSLVIGKPVAMLALDRDATVTICHSKTPDVKRATTDADIVVCATGKAASFDASYFTEDQTIIDVGMNMTDDGSFCGDVDAQAVDGKVAALTPVPGGVGAITTAVLLQHVVEACERARAARE